MESASHTMQSHMRRLFLKSTNQLYLRPNALEKEKTTVRGQLYPYPRGMETMPQEAKEFRPKHKGLNGGGKT